MVRVLAIASQKGGVGKTTASINLAAIWAEQAKVLLIDLDPQGNATSGLGVTDYKYTAADILAGDCKPQEAIVKTEYGELYIIPADINLAAMEAGDLNPNRLAEVMKKEVGKYDLIVIDCPPSLGKLTLNALTLAERVLIPLKPGSFALQGLNQLAGVVESLRLRRVNTKLRILGFFYNEGQTRTQLFKALDTAIKDSYGAMLLDTAIPLNIKLNEAQLVGEPVNIYDRTSKGAEAYRELAGEVLRKWQTVVRS